MVRRVHPARDAGFVLPLSITGALVLLLSQMLMKALMTGQIKELTDEEIASLASYISKQ